MEEQTVTTPLPHLAAEANLEQLRALRPNVAVLPWGALEGHNRHLPLGTDTIEASRLAGAAAALAHAEGARVVVLPPVPFGNNAQQLDQVATIHLSTTTALAILRDVADSLRRQGIRRLVLVNAHGGNEFKPLIRDLQIDRDFLIVRVNFWELVPERLREVFDDPGDHAGEMETSLLMHLTPELVALEQAGAGTHVPFKLATLRQPGVWTPRPWSESHPDTGAGDPRGATAEKGREYFGHLTRALADLLVEMSAAEPEQLPGGGG